MSTETAFLADQDIIQIAEKLPTAPRLLVEFGRLMQNAHLEADEVVGLLRQDPPLVAQIIRMANSVAYAPPEPVGSLQRAIAFVGFGEVHRLVGAVAAIQLAEQRISLYPIDAAQFRLNALFVAVLMEELAKWTKERPHTCYTVGLLRTIGMLALERLPALPGVTVTPFLESGESDLATWEQRTWGLTNVEAAEKILLHWRLPRETALAIRHHYEPEGRHNPVIHLLKLAAGAAAELNHGVPGEKSYWKLTTDTYEKAGLAPACMPSICERAQAKFDRLKIVVG